MLLVNALFTFYYSPVNKCQNVYYPERAPVHEEQYGEPVQRVQHRRHFTVGEDARPACGCNFVSCTTTAPVPTEKLCELTLDDDGGLRRRRSGHRLHSPPPLLRLPCFHHQRPLWLTTNQTLFKYRFILGICWRPWCGLKYITSMKFGILSLSYHLSFTDNKLTF